MSLARHQFTVQDLAGNVVPGAHVEVRGEVPGQPLAVLYSDREGAVVLGNPIDADANGRVFFHALGGAYQIRVYTGASGAPTTECIDRYVAIGLSSETDTVGTKSQRTVTAAGTVIIAPDDADLVLIRKTIAAATRVVLPLSSSRAKQIQIADRKYDAATNSIVVVPKRPRTVTMTLASPCVFALAAHVLAVNDPVSFETTGALYTGLSPDAQYYVKTVPDSGHFTVSLTPGGAAINTIGSQSGVHTMGTDTIMGGALYVIDANGGGILLTPLVDGSGWA